MIPQEPTLFNSSLRDNLDPFSAYSDDEIYKSLECVQMTEAISVLDGGLNFLLSEGGLNFSVGQRQLLCLARAILRKNKILVLDEPTANVDAATDLKLQHAIGSVFEKSTVICVAHRLNTIIEYDKVLVMGDGMVVEMDEPAMLLKRAEGVFASMVDESGDEGKELRVRAEQAAAKRRKEK